MKKGLLRMLSAPAAPMRPASEVHGMGPRSSEVVENGRDW